MLLKMLINDNFKLIIIFNFLTVMMFIKCSAFQQQRQEVLFYADHPFIVAILSLARDVLFLGRLYNPE